MLKFLSRPIPFCQSFKKQVGIALILGVVLAFIMVFLRPFDTYGFESDHSYLILAGFGLLYSLLYLLHTKVENAWYAHENKRWTVKHEAVSFIFLVLVSSIPIHFYNQVFLNNLFARQFSGYEYLQHGLWFFTHALLPVMLMLLPFYIYFRSKFGLLVTSKQLNEIEFYGLNKGERIQLQKETVLFVKSSENYVEIFYEKDNGIQRKTFRNTLAAVKEQAPFLKQCHRSYLVNLVAIKHIKGNSQNAKIEFHKSGLEAPLSKTHYKTIKLSLGI